MSQEHSKNKMSFLIENLIERTNRKQYLQENASLSKTTDHHL